LRSTTKSSPNSFEGRFGRVCELVGSPLSNADPWIRVLLRLLGRSGLDARECSAEECKNRVEKASVRGTFI
jgi:hypothetical protein